MKITTFVQYVVILEWMCLAIYACSSMKMLSNLVCYNPVKASFIILMLSYIARPLGAYIGAKYDKIKTLKYSCIMVIVSCILFAISPTNSYLFIWALICRTIQSIAVGAGYGPSYLLIHNEATINKDKYINTALSQGQFGIFMGVIIGEVISMASDIAYSIWHYDVFLWRFPFIVGAIISVIILYIIYQIPTDCFRKYTQSQKITVTDDYAYLDVYQKTKLRTWIRNICLCIALGIEMGIFYFIHIYVANTSYIHCTNEYIKYSFRLFWISHKLAFLLFLPSFATLADKFNHQYPAARNYLFIIGACILLMIFGIFFKSWPNMWLCIISMLAFLCVYSSLVAWGIERVHPRQYNQIGFILQITAALVGGPLPFLATMLHGNLVILIATLSIITISILYVMEKYMNKKINHL